MAGEIAVVTATAGFHPLRRLKSLAAELKGAGFVGCVLFDLLSVNGLADNRFISATFTGHDFDRASFALSAEIDDRIKKEQDLIARHDRDFLLGSVLCSSEIEHFTR